MSKPLNEITNQDGVFWGFMFWCPGCEAPHHVKVNRELDCDGQRANWDWNGDRERPTFSPSVLCDKDRPESRCHFFVRDGRIEYLSDCFHKLAGQTVEIPDWETASA